MTKKSMSITARLVKVTGARLLTDILALQRPFKDAVFYVCKKFIDKYKSSFLPIPKSYWSLDNTFLFLVDQICRLQKESTFNRQSLNHVMLLDSGIT